MIDAGLVEALNRSVDRLNAGESIPDCLRRYPQYAPQLAPLLEVGQVVKRAQADTTEGISARERQRVRFERVLNQPMVSQRNVTGRSLVRLVATIVLILVLVGGGAGLLAESSLPGDLLYGVKLWTESVRMRLANDDPNLEAAFAARRIEEARQLVQQRRSAEMTFTGTVQAVESDGLWIGGLLVRGENSRIVVGSQVEVVVRSTEQGELIALQIRLINPPANLPEMPPRLPQNAVLTDVPIAMPTISATSVPSREPTLSRQSATPESRSGASDGCPEPPVGWVRYLIQPGDTLSGLAVATGGTINEIMAANCLEDARSIIVGQSIFLSRTVVRTSARPPATETPLGEVPPTAAPPTEVVRPEPTRRGDS